MAPFAGLVAARMASLYRWLLAEPLVHFIVLGAVIFVVHDRLALQGPEGQSRIEITVQDLQRLRDLSVRQWGVEPDARAMQGMVQELVREEVLYREARAQGLDHDDTIVRRRMAQKMEFLAHADVVSPDESSLRLFYQQHLSQYTLPALLDFEHRYFSPSIRGASVQAVAQQSLGALRAAQPIQGDNFMLASSLEQQSLQQVQRDFGAEFAKAVFSESSKEWTGPIRSAHGLHLVRIKQRHSEKIQAYEQVRERVLADANNAALEKARSDAYARLRTRYTVVLPEEVHAAAGTQLSQNTAPPVQAQP